MSVAGNVKNQGFFLLNLLLHHNCISLDPMAQRSKQNQFLYGQKHN